MSRRWVRLRVYGGEWEGWECMEAVDEKGGKDLAFHLCCPEIKMLAGMYEIVIVNWDDEDEASHNDYDQSDDANPVLECSRIVHCVLYVQTQIRIWYIFKKYIKSTSSASPWLLVAINLHHQFQHNHHLCHIIHADSPSDLCGNICKQSLSTSHNVATSAPLPNIATSLLLLML